MRMRATLVCLGTVVAALGMSTTAPADAGAPGPHVKLTVEGGYQCSVAAALRTNGPFADLLEAYAADPSLPEDSPDRYTFALWAADAPAQVTTLTDDSFVSASGRVQVPDGMLVEGKTYTWQVRMDDATGISPWSRLCSFAYDSQTPPQPAVSSPNFPPDRWGAVGRYARFDFNGQGDPDVVGFRWEWNDEFLDPCLGGPHDTLQCPDFLHEPNVVLATRPGGTASVSLNPPDEGPQRLLVESIDRGGNISAPLTYQIYVPDSGPTVSTVGDPCGSTVQLRFAPHKDVRHVISYSYAVDFSSDRQTVVADAEGRARVTLPLSAGSHYLAVRSTSANGLVSSDQTMPIRYLVGVGSDQYPSGQAAGGVGVPGTFTFCAHDYFDTTAFHYSFSDGTVGTVDPNTAQVTWTPHAAGDASVVVVARGADGTKTCPTTYDFTVAG